MWMLHRFIFLQMRRILFSLHVSFRKWCRVGKRGMGRKVKGWESRKWRIRPRSGFVSRVVLANTSIYRHPSPKPLFSCRLRGGLTQAGDVGPATRGRNDTLGVAPRDVVVNLSTWNEMKSSQLSVNARFAFFSFVILIALTRKAKARLVQVADGLSSLFGRRGLGGGRGRHSLGRNRDFADRSIVKTSWDASQLSKLKNTAHLF